MNLNVMRQRSLILFLSALLLFGAVFTVSQPVYSQDLPTPPILSLSGEAGDYNHDIYPGGRIWVPVNNNGPREFLLPIFISNNWKTYNKDIYVVPPIYSFDFRIQYDSTAIIPVGVEKYSDYERVNELETFAKDFNIETYRFKDPKYMSFIYPIQSGVDPFQRQRERGQSLRIVGTSSKPLPVTSQSEFRVLCYVRFRVIPNSGEEYSDRKITPIIIVNDTIRYNGKDVRELAQEIASRAEISAESVLPAFPGIEGIDNTGTNLALTEPIKPGVMNLLLTDVPRLNFFTHPRGDELPSVDVNDPTKAMRNLVIPITSIDDPNPSVGSAVILIKNEISPTRATNLIVETDEPWLQVNTPLIGSSNYDIPSPTRQGVISYIDKDILCVIQEPNGGGAITRDNGNAVPRPVYLQITADPTYLTLVDEDPCGVYTGYVTIRTAANDVNPVKIRVTFIYMNNAQEPDLFSGDDHTGIRLSVKNARPTADGGSQEAKLVFGTAERATDGVDLLCGEYAYESELDVFGARFHPYDTDLEPLIPFGFGDMAPSLANPVSQSRDIRSSSYVKQSIKYLVKFNPGDEAYYPITVEWDVADFPQDAQLRIREISNGVLMSGVNMRNATSIGGTRFSYMITDVNVESFVIEYTLPNVTDFVDEDGNAMIKKGWNLLSLKLDPYDNYYETVYPNAINEPYWFNQNNYQDADYLYPGYGYFVKYSDMVDKKFAGSYITEISGTSQYQVRLFKGWNTIGSCSGPVNVDNIDFDPFDNNLSWLPEASFTKKNGIYKYVTDKGYVEVTELTPGLGHWIKIGKNSPYEDDPVNCYLKISWTVGRSSVIGENLYASERENTFNNATKLVINDNGQHSNNLYFAKLNTEISQFELPPTPPHNLFDVRFNNGANISNNNSQVIELQGVEYPLAISMNNADADYTFEDAVTGEVLGTINKGSNGNVEISELNSNAVRVSRSEEAVAGLSMEAYPNPVSTNSSIRFTIPENSNVTIKLYDIFGNEIQTISDEYRNAGEYTVELNATALNSGAYVCKLVAGNYTSFTNIKVIK